MSCHELEFNGRLAIFTYILHGGPVVVASGYLVHEEGQARLYLTTLSEETLSPPQRLLHRALARFAKELDATHLVPVAYALPSRYLDLTAGLVPTLPGVTLSALDAKLANLPRQR